MQSTGPARILLALLVATGCAADLPRGNAVSMHLSTDPSSLTMIGKTDGNTEVFAQQVSDSLVQYDERLDLVPRVAESWEFSDDRRTLTFRLREGVRWHDGAPVTADDVVFTIDKLRQPETENRPWAPMFDKLAALEAPDARTVVARYAESSPDDLEGWRVPLLPRHLAGLDEDLLTGAYSRHPVGCGPFRFVRYDPGQQIVLEANDDYWDGRPAVDRLVLKIYQDQRTAYQALLAGELDIMALSGNLWEEAQQSDQAERLEAVIYQRLNVWVLGWKQDGSNPFFGDAGVRRAMVLALDREAFADRVLRGLARPGVTTYHPDSFYGEPELQPWPYDPDEARRLLSAAGWRDGDGDGVRERDGVDFAFTLLIPASTQKLTDHMAAWQQQEWAKVGVRAEIEKLEWQAFRERRNAGLFHAAAQSLLFTPNPDQYDVYHSAAREGGYNFWGLDDAEIDRLVAEGRRTWEPEKRREIYRRLQRRLHELEPVTALFYFASPLLHDRRLQGVTATPLGFANTTRGPRLWSWSTEPVGS